MKITVTLPPFKGTKEAYIDGVWYKTDTPVEMEFATAMRYRRLIAVEMPPMPKGSNTYDPSLWKDKKMFGFTGDADDTSGFGGCTVNLIRNSVKDGYDVRWIGRNNGVTSLNPLTKLDVPPNLGMVWHEQPGGRWEHPPFTKNITILPFETTKIPNSWTPLINNFDALFAISDQNVQMFMDSGVKIPIEKIAWGIDPNKYGLLERNNSVFTFGQCGALTERKGTDLAVKAFQLAFPPRIRDVNIIFKTSYNIFKWGVKNDTRMKILTTQYDHNEFIERFWRKIDVFCWPTRGEAWGIPAMECGATGIPAIATSWGGTLEFNTPDTYIPLGYKMVPAKVFTEKVYKQDCGNWCEPSLEELVEKMRWCYYNQDKVKEIGMRAHDYIYKNFLWSNVMPGFYKALDKHL